jgi:hypothetical protein
VFLISRATKLKETCPQLTPSVPKGEAALSGRDQPGVKVRPAPLWSEVGDDRIKGLACISYDINGLGEHANCFYLGKQSITSVYAFAGENQIYAEAGTESR